MMTNSFEDKKARFEALCREFSLPLPLIRESLDTDPCDYTASDEVRFHKTPDGTDPYYHVNHVFAHWLCDLHAASGAAFADKVADVIAGVLDGYLDWVSERSAR